MASNQQRNIDELFRSLERSQEQYLKNLKALHEATISYRGHGASGSQRMERTGSNDRSPQSPNLRTTSTSGDTTPVPLSRATFASETASLQLSPVDRRPRRLTNELADRRRFNNLANEVFDGSGWESDDDSSSFTPLPLLPHTVARSPSLPVDSTLWPRVQKTLTQKSYTPSDLVSHLQSITDDKEATLAVLGEVIRQCEATTLFGGSDSDSLAADNVASTYEVYDIDKNGQATTMHDDRGTAEDEVLDPAVVWDTVKVRFDATIILRRLNTLIRMQNVNLDDNTVGRVTEIKAKQLRICTEQLKQTPYTKQYDHRPADKKAPDHINITECSSVLALALEGEPVNKVPMRRGRRKGSRLGAVYDTFAPYHLLNIQCFPDHIHAENESIRKPFYYNGPYVFLNRLVAEYKDATKRYLQLNDRIEKLITPPHQFMFDVKLRDKLLFEDADFTFSRRYFWAYNSLGVINDGIKSMISAYTDTFTPEFWAGRDRTLWPHPEPDSVEGRNYLGQLGTLRQELEHVIEDLKQVFKANELVRQEIVSLREQLFSGSSVKESRRAIEQGDNIKILTGVSMLFLPLTFVTSVFGITEFTISADDWRFPVTMVGVCVPFFLLIFILQTRGGMRAVRKIGDFIEANMGRWSDRSRSRHERRLQLQQQLMQAAESQASAVGGKRRMSLRRGTKRRKTGIAGPQASGVINGVSVPVQQKGKWWVRLRGKEESTAVHNGLIV
ncbi:hypothetical protein J7T55_010787 [Diaporthe amygdali]|uniref:uncharacterized protein n=1 Tax=Phomopsis amygdali TaxID=1214568 RepID=UPI0022FEB8D1|nr:uncharacterized protein J7T55_010787 [Diaporthe amygdali]KAJ0114398.1 hypothetical protein J7T55_010787 [Diaporthe amygdali]